MADVELSALIDLKEFLETTYKREALASFFFEQQTFYEAKCTEHMRQVPAEVEQAKQAAAMCMAYESALQELTYWIARQVQTRT